MSSIITPEVKFAIKVFKSLREIAHNNAEKKILSKLEENNISIEAAKFQSQGYLSSIIRTIEAIERASTIEKVNTLKNLFIASESSGLIENKPDFYQEILSIFSELSYREILILYYLDEGGLPYTDDIHVKEPERAVDDESLGNPQEQYEEAVQYCAYQVMVNSDVLGALLGRLARTGLIGNAPEWTSLVYFFTPLYRDLKQFFAYEYYGV